MHASLRHRLHIFPGEGRARSPRVDSWPLALAIGLLATAALVWIVLGMGAEQRALRQLPYEQRAAVLGHTVNELREVCPEGRPTALDGHCRELASFAAQFAECSGDCVDVVRRVLAPHPTR